MRPRAIIIYIEGKSYNWSNGGEKRIPLRFGFFEEGSFYLVIRYSVSHERSRTRD